MDKNFFDLLFDPTDVKGLFTLDKNPIGVDCTGWTHDDVTAHANRLQKRKQVSGMYFNTGLLDQEITEAETRNAIRCIGSRLFFVDIDRRSTPYETDLEALQAVQQFVRDTGIPRPNRIVQTGGGIHVYWVLEDVIEPVAWKAYAEAFVALLMEHKVRGDLPLSKNIVCLLRVPGTVNTKHHANGFDVKILPHGIDTRIPNEDFLGFLDAVIPVDLQDLMDGTPPNLLNITKTVWQKQESEAPPAEDLLAVCAVVKWCHENQDAVQEPLWRGALSQAKETAEGAVFAHQISNQYNGYDEYQTEQKIKRIAGPHRCSEMGAAMVAYGNGPDLCGSCKFREEHEKRYSQANTSPIHIARMFGERKRQARVKTEDKLTAKLSGFTPIETQADVVPMPKGYSCRGRGKVLFREIKNAKTGDSKYIPIMEFSPDISVHQVPNMKGTLETVVRFVSCFDDEETEFHLRNIGTNGEKLANHLLGTLTLSVDEPREYATFVRLYAQNAKREKKVSKGFVTYGWHKEGTEDRQFVLGRYGYTKDKRLTPLVEDRVIEKAYFVPQGDPEVWPNMIRQYYSAPDVAHLALAIGVSFGAPLVEIAGPNSQCSVLLHSTESGTGKSTALQAAAAVWGEPVTGEGLFRSAGDSQLALMESFAQAHNLPVFMEEIPTEYKKDMAGYLKTITEGQVKKRLLNAEGDARQTTPFKLIAMMTSNWDLSEELLVRGAPDRSSLMRLIKIYCPPVDSTNTMQAELGRALAENYGYVGHQYIAHIARTSRTEIRKLIDGTAARLAQEVGVDDDSDARIQLRTMACILVGCYLANSIGLFPVDYRQLCKAAVEVLTRNLQAIREVTRTNLPIPWLYGHLFEENPASIIRFEDSEFRGTVANSDTQPVTDMDRVKFPVLARLDDSTKLFVATNPLREAVRTSAQFSVNTLKQELTRAGILLRESVQFRINENSKRPRAWLLDAELLAKLASE